MPAYRTQCSLYDARNNGIAAYVFKALMIMAAQKVRPISIALFSCAIGRGLNALVSIGRCVTPLTGSTAASWTSRLVGERLKVAPCREGIRRVELLYSPRGGLIHE